MLAILQNNHYQNLLLNLKKSKKRKSVYDEITVNIYLVCH